MTAQPMPSPLQLEGGIDVKSDDVAIDRPQRILNAHYARSGALSKRFGYEAIGTDTFRELPQAPLPGDEDGYLALDGDKFFARKNRNGVDFYQRPDGRNVGNAGTWRPRLTQLPGYKPADVRQDVLVDVARTQQAFNSWAESANVVFYARLELNYYDPALDRYVYDIVVNYISALDGGLTVRAETRIPSAIPVSPRATRHQLRMMTGVPFTGSPAGIILVYTTDRTDAPGRGIYYRAIYPGPTPDLDTLTPEYCIVNTSSVPPAAFGSLANDEMAAAFDCETPFDDGGIGLCYAGVAPAGTAGMLAFAKVRTSGHLTATTYSIFQPSTASFPTSIAMAGILNGIVRETIFSFVASTGAQHAAYCGKFQYTVPGVPSIITTDTLAPFTDIASSIPPMASVAGIFSHYGSGTLRTAMLAGVNSGIYGFRYMFSDLGQAAFYGVLNTIDCAWATGRPFSLYSTAGDWVRSVMPMVSWSAELGGGTGLLVDITPPLDYQNGATRNGAKLLATYSVDQISLTQRQVTVTVSSVTVWQSFENESVTVRPCSGSHVGFGAEDDTGRNRVRWILATGQPPTPMLLELRENKDDFEFIEPGVMLVGPGVPVMLDAINGLSELGFHTSPGIMQITTPVIDIAIGWPAGTILQYRFQYRFIDGLGRPQVSPPTEPIQVTAPAASTCFQFKIAAYDATLRTNHVLIDVYRTDPSQATFYLIGTLTAEGGEKPLIYVDYGPKLNKPVVAQTINVENYWMTPPCADHAFRGAFRDVIVTRENELWPSIRRLSTTAPQYDIVNAGAWDSYESVVTGGEIDGKLILFSKSRIAYSYEMNGTLAPFTEIPSDTGALMGSRAFSTHLGVFYQSTAGIRVIGRDMAIHETGLVVQPIAQGLLVRGGVKVPDQGEIRLRLDKGAILNRYLVFDYFHGNVDQPVWYEFVYDSGEPYTAPDGSVWQRRQFVDQVYGWNGRLIFLCRSGDLLMESNARYKDLEVWASMIVRTPGPRGRTAISYLAAIEGAVNLEKGPTNQAPERVTLRLRGDYEESRIASAILVQKSWTDVETFNRRQIQITGSEELMNAPDVSFEYDDTPVDPTFPTTGDGFGYRLSAMVMVTGERDPKVIFPVANGARK